MHLNHKTYHIARIKPRKLSAFINWFTLYHFHNPAPVNLIPEGYFELIFQLGNQFKQRAVDSPAWESRPQQFIGGLHNKSYDIKPEQNASSLISVNFKPNCARYFIPDKLQLYKNRIAGLDEVFSKSKLAGQIGDLNPRQNAGHAVDIIESFLLSILRERANSRIDLALKTIVHHNGFVNVGELTKVACLSGSQLRKRFNEEVGMSPGEYSKILRVNHIFRHLQENPNTKLTHLSYDLGYFDQSHFIKDFKSVTGLSPKAYKS